jgi:hypothetical protein
MPVHAIMEAVKFCWKQTPESALILYATFLRYIFPSIYVLIT